jgi:ubiquinone/menaquinone biosynthesis C-methylase UbiE
MIYTIEEKNLERQHLLAQFLEPLSLHALENISLQRGSKILDIGCGLGETTLMLSKRFPETQITGLDEDDALIEVARATKREEGSTMHFIKGSALHLPFTDNSFDFVFTRYCLLHIPDSPAVLEEMKRVCKTGAIVFAQEPDVNFKQSYPENWAYPKLTEFANQLFADACIGRKLISYFRSLKLEKIAHIAEVVLADYNSIYKKILTMLAEALRSALLRNKLADEKQLDELIRECRRIENDPEAVVLTNPTIAVWGIKV